MKKLLLIAIIMALCITTACSNVKNADISRVNDRCGLSITDNSTVTRSLDSTGGPHGDGERVISIKLTDEDAENAYNKIVNSSAWKELPLDEEHYKYFYGGIYNGEGVDPEKYTGGEKDFGNGELSRAGIPRVENGYYYFIDNCKDDNIFVSSDYIFNNYGAHSYYLVLYDADNKSIHYLYEND